VLHHWCKSLFADELLIIIKPREILLKRIDKQIVSLSKSKIVNTKRIEFVEDTLGQNAEEYDWASLTNYLRQALAEPICHGTLPHIVLSNQFVRYAVVPWKNELSKTDERIAFTAHCFTQAFGERIKDWNFCISQPEYGQSSIASAIEPSLVTKIHEVFDALIMPLHAITPDLMLIFNHIVNQAQHNHLINAHDENDVFWIASIQNQQLCLALHDESGWRLLKSMTSGIDVIAQIETIIHREVINSNLQKDIPVLLYWPELDQAKHSLSKSFIRIAPYYLDDQKKLSKEAKPDWVIA
jgi:hypothetical protein